MEEAWKQHLSELLKTELTRLQAGNTTQRRRFQQVMAAITRVLQFPENPKNVKSDIGGHWAVDICDQFRLFYYIEHEHHLIHFVWLNDETYIHTTRGFKDHCYEHFKKMIHDGEIQRYVPVPEKIPSFEKDGEFGSSDYINFKAKLEKGTAHSAANLAIVEDPLFEMYVPKNEFIYSILFLKAENAELQEHLLKWICELADEAGVNLSYILPKTRLDFHELKKLLLQVQFDLINAEKEEIFLRKHVA